MTPLLLSVVVAGVGVVLAAIVGIAVASALPRRRGMARAVLQSSLMLPLVLPPTVLGWYLLVLLGQRGAIGRAWQLVTGTPLVFSRAALVVATFLAALPLVVQGTRAALDDVDPRLLDAARTLGASPWRVMTTVALPLARNGIVAACALGFARALGDFGVTLMIGGDIPGVTRTASLALYEALQAGHDDDARRMAMTLSACALACLVIAARALGSVRDAR